MSRTAPDPQAMGIFYAMTTLILQDNTAPQTEERPPAIILDGRVASKKIREECTREVAALLARHGILPGLAVVRVGDDPAAGSYAEGIRKTFAGAGLTATIVELPANVTRPMLQAELGRLNVLPEIAGVLVLMPLPEHMGLDAVVDVLDPKKDIEGIDPVNIGRLSLGFDSYVPATPAGGVALLDHYSIPIEGRRALIVGRSGVVGKPLAQLLLMRHATVTIAHSRSRDLPALVAEADIVAAATGRPGLIRGEWLKLGAVVLDFGASVVEGRMTGDVHYESALQRAGAITPVPGGTGPMTNALLLRNTIKAIRRYMGA